ncbi:hypothetical protein EPI10_000795 [Gossypium australe]|uniref:Uncharacterized protein n=1 Tax=Gossypium australe TaxID=47621 RepID=A0A5B6V8Y4_9ROSI|nr:hypothetical protein EPI10_000795 [Gossypium australe]
MPIFPATEANHRECLIFNPLNDTVNQYFRGSPEASLDESKPLPRWDRAVLDQTISSTVVQFPEIENTVVKHVITDVSPKQLENNRQLHLIEQ